MSRTYRRKNDVWDFSDYDYEFKNGFMKKIKYEKNSNKYKKEKARFHSDSYRGMKSVPSWFVNEFCERPYRYKTKNLINNFVGGKTEDVVLPTYKKSAAWLYW